MTDAESSTLAALAARLDRLEGRNAELEERTRALEGENAALREAGAPSAGRPADETGGGIDRRQVLRRGLAVAGAAAAGAVLLDGAPAAAANGNALVIGVNNAGTSETRLTHDGGSHGLHLISSSPNGAAIRASGIAGGVVAYGNRFHLELERSGIRTAPTLDARINHRQGELVLDATGTLWTCVADGAPGTWRTLSGNRGATRSAGALYVLPSPVRVYDSRPGSSPAQGPKTALPAGGTRTLDLKVPAAGITGDVTAAVLNILLVNAATGSGNFTVWAAGTDKPLANTLVWGGNAGRFSTLAVTAVDAQGRVQVNASLGTHLVVDVVGYHR